MVSERDDSEEYLDEEHEESCPYCGSHNLEYNEKRIYNFYCLDCKEQWVGLIRPEFVH